MQQNRILTRWGGRAPSAKAKAPPVRNLSLGYAIRYLLAGALGAVLGAGGAVAAGCGAAGGRAATPDEAL